MADYIYTTQVATEVIQAQPQSYLVRATAVAAEVVETHPTDYKIRSSQVAVEVIVRLSTPPSFIGWGFPISSS